MSDEELGKAVIQKGLEVIASSVKGRAGFGTGDLHHAHAMDAMKLVLATSTQGGVVRGTPVEFGQFSVSRGCQKLLSGIQSELSA